MTQFKKTKVIMLPTNESKGNFSKDRIYPCILKHSWMFDNDEKGKLIYSNSNIRTPTQLQHLYIISDDEIKKGDWYIYLKYNTIIQKKDYLPLENDCKKIIATTDTSLEPKNLYGNSSLFKTKLPQPSQQFIEKYIEEYNKGNIITDVLVEYDNFISKNSCNLNDGYYSRIKINPKDNTITIKKLKDNWNREKVSNLIKLFANNYQYASNDIGYNKWIEENL